MNHHSSLKKSCLRAEAGAFDWQYLTVPQQRALVTVSQLLRNDCKVLDTANERGSKTVDRTRLSRVAFIDGDRGMGKTSVLVTLQRLIEKGELEDLTDSPDLEDLLWLKNRRSRIYWLETLDMEPLPENANLLAAILVRIDEALRGDSPRSFLDDLDAKESITADLAQLEQDAVISWRGSSPERISSIDPSYAAQEVLMTERAALELNQRLGSVLDRLAERLNKGVGAPIFLLPVDDFDLAPAKCLELLRIIRMVTTPRLFFLIAGNTRMAEQMLRLQSEGELASLAGRMTTASTSRIQAAAVEISANNLRKLIPPRQRINLRVLRASEALDIRIPGPNSGVSPEAGERTLRSVLSDVHIDLNYPPDRSRKMSLLEHIQGDPDVNYSGFEWLRGTPRQTQDRADLFRRHEGANGDFGESLLQDVVEEVRAELLEDRHSDASTVDAVQELFRSDTRILGVGFRKHFAIDYGTYEHTRRFRTENAIYSLDFNCYIPTRYEWILRQRQELATPAGTRASDTLTFVHDLAVSLWGGYVESNSILYSNHLSLQPAEVRWQLYEATVTIPWSLPEWWTIRSHEGFWQRFTPMTYPSSVRQELGHLPERFEDDTVEERSLDQYIAAWIEASFVTLGAEEPPTRGRQSPEPSALVRAEGFIALEKGFANLFKEKPSRASRRYTVRSAIVNLVLLLAPESGAGQALSPLCDAVLHRLANTQRYRREYADLIGRIRVSKLVTALGSQRNRPAIGREVLEHFVSFVASDEHTFNHHFPIAKEEILHRVQRSYLFGQA